MNVDLKTTIMIVEQVKALVRAIESLDVIEHDSPWERQVATLLRAAYRRKLREIAETAPASIRAFWIGWSLFPFASPSIVITFFPAAFLAG